MNDLARAAGVSRITVVRFEDDEVVSDATRSKVEEALVRAGATFGASSGEVCVTVKV